MGFIYISIKSYIKQIKHSGSVAANGVPIEWAEYGSSEVPL